MKFKEFAGTAFMPTISRLVLAFAFITVGYNKLTTTSEFSFDEKTILESHAVSVTTQPATAAGHGNGRALLASFRQVEAAQDDPAQVEPTEEKPAQVEPTEEKPAEEKPTQVEPAEEKPTQVEPIQVEPTRDAPATKTPGGAPAEAPDQPAAGIPGPVTPAAAQDAAQEPVQEPAPGEVYTARSLYRITLLCDRAGWPLPKWCAWMAATAEFLGGCMLLVGFLSRIWSLGLCIAMGSAFYLVSMSIYEVHTTNPFVFARDVGKFNTVFNQLGLLVLALGVLLTGPGPLSLDRFIFRPKKAGEIVFDDEDEDLGPSSGAARMDV